MFRILETRKLRPGTSVFRVTRSPAERMGRSSSSQPKFSADPLPPPPPEGAYVPFLKQNARLREQPSTIYSWKMGVGYKVSQHHKSAFQVHIHIRLQIQYSSGLVFHQYTFHQFKLYGSSKCSNKHACWNETQRIQAWNQRKYEWSNTSIVSNHWWACMIMFLSLDYKGEY